MNWTWAQVLEITGVESQTICRWYLKLEVSKDGGDYAEVPFDPTLWNFKNFEREVYKKVTDPTNPDHTSQVGVYIFKYSVRKNWNY